MSQTSGGLSTIETGGRGPGDRYQDVPFSGLDEPARVDKIYQLTYEDGTVIETTWSHPFYIEGKGWVKAEELRAGDVSKTDKGTLRITKVHVDPRSEEVYNFEVAENHTYLVTDQGVVVHNAEKYGLDAFSEVWSPEDAYICKSGATKFGCTPREQEVRAAQAQKLYAAIKKTHPDKADLQYLQDLFETGIVSDSDDLNEKLAQILEANQGDSRDTFMGTVNPGFMFQIESSDQGLSVDFQDPHPSSRRQPGHFLTAAYLAQYDSDLGISAIISHEQVSDDANDFVRAKGPFLDVPEADVTSFRNAIQMVYEDKGDLQRGMDYLRQRIHIDDALTGNSYQNLNLSLAGYWMGHAIKSGYFKNDKEVVKWMRSELGD